MTTKDKYIEKIKFQLDGLSAQVDKLAATSMNAKKEIQDKYKQELADLRGQSHKAKAKLDELRHTSDDVWEDSVAEMDKINAAFKHSYNYFKSQL
jgi:chromosome segregation ATPase